MVTRILRDKMNLNLGLRVQLASCVTMGVLLCCIFSVKLLSRGHDVHRHPWNSHGIDHSLEFIAPPRDDDALYPPFVPKPVRQLLAAIRAASREAAGGTDPPALTDEELAEWELAMPCRSRAELGRMYARRKGVTDMADNPLWEMVLREYAKLHRTCMLRVGNVRDSFVEKQSIPGCKFAIADIDYGIPAGLSNRILSVTSVVLYSILTQRVVLVPRSTLITRLMCEPFPGSSWDLEANGSFSWYPWSEEGKPIWMFHEDVYTELDDRVANHTTSYLQSPRSNVFAASMALSQYHPDKRFFCDTEQASFTGVKWMYFTGCIYTIPKLFAIPSLRPTLEALFPGRFVLTQMLRSIMLPGDAAWAEVVRSEETHFRTPGVRVGIQIRYYYGLSQYENMNDVFNQRILACALNNGILPALAGQQQQQQPVKVFVASLYTGFQEHMSKEYFIDGRGSAVEMIQLSNNSVQKFGVEVDTQSLMEIFLLSFSDTLLNTPISTFGGLAQAYGSLIPWKIETRKGDDLPACERDMTVDLCYQTAANRYSCQYNNVNGLRMVDLVPYFKTCLKNFTQEGIQLVTDPTKETYRGSGIKRLGSLVNPSETLY